MTGTEGAGAGPSALRPGPMTETEFRSLYERLRGQVPWGPDDRRGALNYITQAEILAALGEVTLGRAVSLAAPVEDRPAADNPDPARHQMTGPLGADAGPGLAFSMDRIAMNRRVGVQHRDGQAEPGPQERGRHQEHRIRGRLVALDQRAGKQQHHRDGAAGQAEQVDALGGDPAGQPGAE